MPAAPDDLSPITFVIQGQRQVSRGGAPTRPGGAAGLPGVLKDGVRLSSQRGGGDTVRLEAVPGEDVVVLHLAGGPALVLHPATARDLMLGQGKAQRGPGGVPPEGEVEVPAQLRWKNLEAAAPTRSGGFLGDVLLSAVEVITGIGKGPLVDLASSLVVKKVDGQVDAGVYALHRGSLQPLKATGRKLAQVPAPDQPARQPLLVLVHGTFVDTYSTFGKLWTLHPQRVAALFDFYGDRVYALDHPTVGVSPVANALTLVQALPAGARLHLVTHSRGGLVAEVLARVCGQRELGAEDLAAFADPAWAGTLEDLQALATAVRTRDIQVDRIVRVACPARGTLLASKRLDAYLSVLKWTIELTGVPVVPELVDFLAEVARTRADPTRLPGLAAMIPDTPLVDWLNAAEEPIPGELRVVAGDLQGDSVGAWLKTLLADAYYWTDNDIVVQTSSMYGGSPRAGGASFLLDQGGKVTHFNYFANERTVQAVVAGLTQVEPAGFRTIGPLSWAGQDSSGQRAARRGADDPRPAGAKPAVFVLPGILGSHLKAGDKRIWLSLRLIGGLGRLRYQSGGADQVLPDGPIGLVYDDLMDFLARDHEVIPFAFDWRRPIEEEARRLADAVDAALEVRQASGQPVRLLAHSMGGVLARTMLLERPQTFERLMKRDGARLLMLGTPNGGSWAPMQVLSGDDTFGNALAAFGSPLRDRQARQLMAEMPGFIQLQADLLDPQRRLDQQATWARLAADDLRRTQESNWWHGHGGESQQAAYEWGVPPQEVLDQARRLRQRLDEQRDQVLPAYADKMLLVVGHARFTPDGYEEGSSGFTYLDATDGGDGRVPLWSAMLPGVRTWKLDCEHGSLPDASRAFEAFAELLERGDTRRLDRHAPAGQTRAAGAGAVAMPVVHVRSRPARGRPSGIPAGSQVSVFTAGRGPLADVTADPDGAALRVTVLNGNLSFVRLPLMVGHSRSLKLTGTEDVVNRLVGQAMKASLDAGLYPDRPGTHQIFVNAQSDPDNPWRAPQPSMAIVVGLGDEGSLTEQDIIHTVRQGTIAWAQRRAEGGGAPTTARLAATLLGSGGVGMNASNAARAIAQGVREANDRMRASGWPLVGELVLVELYLERASDAWHGLQVLASSAPGRFEIAPVIQSGIGPLRRQIDSGYRGADYDFITATSSGEDTITFALDTKRARTEVRAQSTQGKLLRELVARASTANNADPRLGNTLFQLLVPPEVEPFLSGTSRMLLELDDQTAPIPWELLGTRDDGRARSDERPWAIRTQLLRKLRQENFRQAVQDASIEDAVLVVGEPRVDARTYPALPGARAEAQAVVAALSGSGGLGAQRVTALVNDDDAASVINALFERRYRIVHIAGHGEPVHVGADGRPTKGGVVLSDGTFLGSDEIRSMRTVPELVFVNCCHLAARDSSQVLREPFDRARFAWGVADSLIEIGVRCVIAAGWAVDDGPAKVFATTFYRHLLDRQPFITAVAAAREAAWLEDKHGNTWAAYQAYGDPNWTYRRDPGEAASAPLPPTDEYEGVASPLGLALALEELAVKSKFMRAARAGQLERVRHLENRFAPLWGGMGAVAEAFGLAYAEAGDRDTAIEWYARALEANDASASIKAHEQHGNLRARRGWAQAEAATSDAELSAARDEIVQALRGLLALAGLQPTVERHSLCGSANKRLAMLEFKAGRPDDARAALAAAAGCYAQAEALARRDGHPELFYPGLNGMALELVTHLDDPGWPGFDDARQAAIRDCLHAKIDADPDFWCHAGLNELDMYLAVAARNLAGARARLEQAYAELHGRVSGRNLWASVADQARLLLPAYGAAASDAERNAAHALLRALEAYAEPA